MTARVLIFMMAFLFSACATNLSQTPQLPKVKMEGNRLVEPEYGYSIQIPNGWQILDEGYLAMFPPDSRQRMSEHLNRLIDNNFRALFLETFGKAGIAIFAHESTYKTKEDLITFWRESRPTIMRNLNNRPGNARIYNLEFNRFKNLTDLNATYEGSDGRRTLSYLYVYNFKQSIYGIELDFNANHNDFDSCLPLFYDCVNSLNVSGRSASHQERESGKTINERLEELRRLKDRNLITDEEYEKTKKKLLDDL